MLQPTIDERVERLTTCPAGCALLLIAEEQRLQPPNLASPETAFLVTGAAIEAISPWNPYGNAWLKGEALRHGPRL